MYKMDRKGQIERFAEILDNKCNNDLRLMVRFFRQTCRGISDKVNMKKDKKPAIIVDLDGTLADSTHRYHHVVSKEWDDFDKKTMEDKVIPWCQDLLNVVGESYWLIFLTARSERSREDTTRWIKEVAKIDEFDKSLLFMRKKEWDSVPDYLIKEFHYWVNIYPYYDVRFALEDIEYMTKWWRSLGIPTLHCDDWTGRINN